jgi:hypothetical protein
MTDRMPDEQLDGEIRTYLAWQAGDIADAPTATEMAMRISERAGARTRGLRLTPQIVWVVLAGLLILALIGGAVGAMSLRQPVQPPLSKAYEAVFLRLDVVDGAPEVHVFGVNTEGHERQIAGLPGAWVAYDIQATQTGRGFLAPMGAVSPSGLLAIPSGGGDLMMHWEIFDLHRPQAEPIVIAGMEQFVEQLRETPYWKVNGRGGVFWGPGDRLANLWYAPGSGEVHLQLSVIDGRMGSATAVPIPAGLVVLPDWASDGSGVFVGNSSNDAALRRVLRVDGSVVDAPAAMAMSSCSTPSGFAFACLAPDDSMIADIAGGTNASRRVARVIAQSSGASFEIEGSFAGWLEVDR